MNGLVGFIAARADMHRAEQAESIRANGIDLGTERWIRHVMRQGSKAGRGWYRSGCFAFRYIRKNTWEYRLWSGPRGVIAGSDKADAYARLAEAIEDNA